MDPLFIYIGIYLLIFYHRRHLLREHDTGGEKEMGRGRTTAQIQEVVK